MSNKTYQLTTDAQERKRTPIFSGVLKYFPLALAAVARVSFRGNEQHNPGEPLHWARGKSKDQLDAAIRHIIDYGMGNMLDDDGEPHLAKAAWRLLAQCQLDEERRADGESWREGTIWGQDEPTPEQLAEFRKAAGAGGAQSVHEFMRERRKRDD